MSLVRRILGRFAPGPERDAMRRVFQDVYRTGAWGRSESASGPGSGVIRTHSIRADLRALLAELEVRSLLDAGCGDFNWMKEADLAGCRYVGVDVVPELIARNRAQYAGALREFRAADITRDPLPA